jgi:penicillin-binding protein 1A
MVRQEYITVEQARAAAAQLFAVTPAADTNIFRYWTDYVAEEITSVIGNNFANDLFVYTTLDSDLQDRAAGVVRRRVSASTQNVEQGAVIAMSHGGAIRAMVGGVNYQGSQFNRTTAMRQPGSTFKPIVYLVALENGVTPQTHVNDSPFAIGDYNPRNFNEKYYGDISLATAFARSVNSVPLKLTEQFGLNNVLRMAGRLGVGARLKREYSTVLGASEMTLIDLTTMYDVIWNNGFSVVPYSIEKIQTPQGKVLFARKPSEPSQVLHPITVGFMREMLADVVRSGGTGARANTSNTIGGKTGTSNDFRDAWFVGATQSLTIGVWVGNDNFTPMDRITGGTIPAEIFKDIVQ